MSQLARVFVTTTAENTSERPWSTANYMRLLRAGGAYRGDDFALVPGPETADFVVFVDSSDHFLGDVLRSETFRRHRERSFVYNHNDAAIPILPGIYPDLPGPVRVPELQVGGFYLRSFDNQLLAPATEVSAWAMPEYLFSFVGDSRTAPGVRGRVLRLEHPRARLIDRSSGLRDDDADYATILRASRFVVCPRGKGPTSWRFYETMMAGRVPIIVSDQWVPAREIAWEKFSLRVPEKEIESIPDLCEQHAATALEMGQMAREEWEAHCAEAMAFGWVGRRLLELAEARRSQPSAGSGWDRLRELRYRRAVVAFLRNGVGRALRRWARRSS